MTVKNQLFICDICQNVVEITHEGADALVCCSESMRELKEKMISEGDPHFAIVENNDKEKLIKFNHEMTNEHHIEFIEAISGDGKYLKRKFLDISEPAGMKLKCDCQKGLRIRVYCNVHGLLTTQIN